MMTQYGTAGDVGFFSDVKRAAHSECAPLVQVKDDFSLPFRHPALHHVIGGDMFRFREDAHAGIGALDDNVFEIAVFDASDAVSPANDVLIVFGQSIRGYDRNVGKIVAPVEFGTGGLHVRTGHFETDQGERAQCHQADDRNESSYRAGQCLTNVLP